MIRAVRRHLGRRRVERAKLAVRLLALGIKNGHLR